MAIVSKLAVIMADRGISGKELAEKINITEANLSKLKTGKLKPSASQPSKPSALRLTANQRDLLIHKK